jgi:hypothetical protein
MSSTLGVHVRPLPQPTAATGVAAGPETGQASVAERRLGMLICAATVAGSAALLLVLLLAALA